MKFCDCGTRFDPTDGARECPGCAALSAPRHRRASQAKRDRSREGANLIGLRASVVAAAHARIDPAQAARTAAARARALRGIGRAPRIVTPPRPHQDADVEALARRWGVTIRGAR